MIAKTLSHQQKKEGKKGWRSGRKRKEKGNGSREYLFQTRRAKREFIT